MYAGTLILKLLLLLDSGQEDRENGRSLSLDSIKNVVYEFIESTFSLASDISAWRNYLVVSNFNVKLVTFSVLYVNAVAYLIFVSGFRFTLVLLFHGREINNNCTLKLLFLLA